MCCLLEARVLSINQVFAQTPTAPGQAPKEEVVWVVAFGISQRQDGMGTIQHRFKSDPGVKMGQVVMVEVSVPQ